MNICNECYILYDKYATGSHSFSNPATKNITIKHLFEVVIDMPGTIYLSGSRAVDKFNQTFGNSIGSLLPNDIDYNILTPYMFCYKDEENIDITVTIIGIFITKLTEYYNKYKDVPNRDIICTACKFHVGYERPNTTEKKNDAIDKACDISQYVMIPNADLMDPSLENPIFMADTVKLFDYQRRNIRWMIESEKKPTKIHYGKNHMYEIELGPLVYDIVTKNLTLNQNRDSITFSGGALLDDVGLGKTIQMITLSLANPPPVNMMGYHDEKNNRFKSCATLVLCPSHLCKQWAREIANKIGRKDLKIVEILTKTHFDKYTYQDLMDADFVIISYTFIGNQCFVTKFTSEISKSKSYIKSAQWSNSTMNAHFDKLSQNLIKNPATLFETGALFHLISWHRIVIDEFHEIYTNPSYIYIVRLLPHFKATYKWAVTGTPFDKDVNCFFRMIDFVIDNKNILNNDIILKKDIEQHMRHKFFRRNTKKSTEDEVKLPELKEKIIYLKFTHTERMMYNAYSIDPNINRDSVILRQLCCHPKIANEIKGVLNKCKTLEDIENTMVGHYKRQYILAERHVTKLEMYVAKTKRRILVAEYKRQRGYVKKQGYRTTIELPPFTFTPTRPEQELPVIEENDIGEDEDDTEINETGIQDITSNNVDELNNIDNNEGLDINNDENTGDEDEDEDEDNDENTKPLYIINDANQADILRMVGAQLKAKPSMAIKAYVETLEQQQKRLADSSKIYNGKKTSYTFFTNMLERIKKITTNSHRKLEIAMERDKKRFEMGDKYVSDSDSDDEDENDTCGICLSEISGDNVGVTNCGHTFCYECLKITVTQLHKCPACSSAQSNKDITRISYEMPVYTKDNRQNIKSKLDMINKVGTKLTNLIYYLNTIKDHVIIFSQWDSLLKKVGEVLTDHGIKNVFCRGNVWMRDKAIREFNTNDNIKVIMLSSQSAASGANLTKASKTILLEPVSGSYEHRRNVEWQAVGRMYRLGQKNICEIVRFIIKDTIEEEIYRENIAEDSKQNTPSKISEITDETIIIGDDSLKSIEEASQRAKAFKEQKQKEFAEKKEIREKARKNQQNVDTIVIKIAKTPQAKTKVTKNPNVKRTNM